MNLKIRLDAFISLGEKIGRLSTEEIDIISEKAQTQNPWFTRDNVEKALKAIATMLKKEKVIAWANNYNIKEDFIPRIVGVIMAGNIPLVGFHDLVAVLVSGNVAIVKPSSEDVYLTKLMVDWIVKIEPRFKKNIEIRERINNIEAVIATGSDNTSRYFEYYFRNVPHIIRKNRTSIAVLTGKESNEELEKLGNDIFSYFGLGCRNVAKVYTPSGYDISNIFPYFENHKEIIHHHKYRNNYDYYKSIYLVNRTPHLDTGFLLVNSTSELVSPLSVLYHQEYQELQSLDKALALLQNKIQCRVGLGGIPFGTAQHPELWDYPDNIDIMSFLTTLD